MELGTGFKLSEVGPIPEDWEVYTLGTFDPFVTSGSRGWAKHYSSTGDLFVRITNMSRDDVCLDLSDVRYVTPSSNDAEARRTALQRYDLLISITADIGIVSLITEDVPLPAYVNQHVAAVRLNGGRVDPRYVAYSLKSPGAGAWFRSITDAGAKAGINLATVRAAPFAAPGIEEQRAISATLAEIDGWITEAEAEAAKLASVKAAAIDALLTPTARLPGFRARWERNSLGTLLRPHKGSGLSKAAVSRAGTRPCLLYGELFTTYSHVIRSVVSYTDVDDGFSSEAGDILLPGSTTTVAADLAKASALLVAGVRIGGDTIVLRAITPDLYCPQFLAYVLTERCREQIASTAQGTTIIHLHGKSLMNVEVELPPLAEQRAIASVLSDIDAALAAARAVVAKARGVKAAAMDALLSGRVRLPPFGLSRGHTPPVPMEVA